MSRSLEFPRPSVFDDDYWLCRCDGFRVDGPSGRIGIVADVRFRSRLDRPDELVVRGGLLGNRVTIVPVNEITKILPRHARIVVSGGHEQPTHDRLGRLRGYLATTISGR